MTTLAVAAASGADINWPTAMVIIAFIAAIAVLLWRFLG